MTKSCQNIEGLKIKSTQKYLSLDKFDKKNENLLKTKIINTYKYILVYKKYNIWKKNT